jgi:hypothetical protein
MVFDEFELCGFCLDHRYDNPERVAFACVGAWLLSNAAFSGEARLSGSPSQSSKDTASRFSWGG